LSDATRIPREEQRSGFDRFAEASSRFVSKGGFFTISLVVVLIWMPTIVLFSSVDTWQLVINTMTSVLAFLLIALLQNSERRYDEALHRKIDALVLGVADLLESQQAGDGRRADAERLRRDLEELRAAVELEERV
jgi:low affinity Fe/Cu permease